MGGQIIHNDGVARPEFRNQNLFDVSHEGRAIHRPIENEGRDQAVTSQTSGEGCCFPMSMRDGGAASFAAFGPSAQAGHFRRCAAFVNKNKRFRVKVKLTLEPGLPRQPDVFAILFRRVCGFF